MIRARLGVRCALGAVAVLAALASAVVPSTQPASGAAATPGMAGTDVSLPLTDSAVTLAGRGPYAGMEVTVNQTRDLTNQAVSVTWRGAPPTVSQGLKLYFGNFVQIMQCWGEPDALVADNPGPPPEQCVFGALNPTAASELQGFASSMVSSRAFTHESFADFDPALGTRDESGEIFRDFVAVDGTVVTEHVDHTATGPFDQFWQNPYFNSVTSNEQPGVRTLEDGRGQALMTVNTGLESRGLGCGQRVQPSASGPPTVPRCWLVIVPRGLAEVENEGTPFGAGVGVATSPMRPAAWQHRIAVELAFTPVDSPCDIAADQRQITGTELAVAAVSSWQPVLCTRPGLLPYAYGVVSDALARQQLATHVEGAPGMVAVNRPLPEDASTPDDPILYAPLSASAISIGFNVERVPSLATTDLRLQGVRFADINLTPRLVAKLLTQSYRSQVEIAGSRPYEWDDPNPVHMLVDPDFLRFNPEFALWQSGSGKHAGGLTLPIGSSDLASQVWDWILADPEAAAWLAGTPDEWGMVVNPVYGATAESNSTGIPFATPPPDSFPKSDPYCFQAAALVSGVVPPPLCSLDWAPYAAGYADAARFVASANDGARTVLNRFAGTVNDVWKRSSAQGLGRRTIFGITDLPSATNLGLQSARLSRAGDDGADREFIAPDADALGRAVQSMQADGAMLRLDPAAVDPGAYPLTTVTYAAVRPFALDEAAREHYAAFLDHAAGPGQTPGQKLGQLPPGYLPLPDSLAQRTAAVADDLRTLQPPPDPAAPPPAGGASPPPPEPFRDFGSIGGAGTVTPADPATGPVDESSPDEREESMRPVSQRTPALALGLVRYAVAGGALLALAAALAALEITKRPRRRHDAVTRSTRRRTMARRVLLVAIAVAAAIAVGVAPATAQGGAESTVDPDAVADPPDEREESMRPLERGGSATPFGFVLEGEDECPGDSAHDQYRIDSYMVPMSVDPTQLMFTAFGPTPPIFRAYAGFQMPLYKLSEDPYAAELTSQQIEPGGPGPIPPLPAFGWGVYVPTLGIDGYEGGLPSGEYRIGLACTYATRVTNLWETTIEVAQDETDEPVGMAWTVTGSQPRELASTGSASGPTWLMYGLVAFGLVMAALAVALRRSSRRSPTDAAADDPGSVSHEGSLV